MPKDMPQVDMSPQAIDRRLRTLSELFEFAQSLKGVRWLGEVRELQAETAKEDSLPAQKIARS